MALRIAGLPVPGPTDLLDGARAVAGLLRVEGLPSAIFASRIRNSGRSSALMKAY